MASLTGTKIKDTYDALLKVSDNGALDGTLQTITDGLGNNSALSLSTAGASVGGTLAVSGNLTVDTNTLFVDAANNRVGVGTSSPSERLEVNGNIELSTSENTIQWQSGNGIIQAPSSLYVRSTGAGSLVFQTNTTERMKIQAGGDISFRDSSANEAFYWDASAASLGIGVNPPTEKLDVYGSIKIGTTANANFLNRSDSHWINYNGGATTNDTFVRVASVSAASIGRTISFHTNAAERMRIDSSGNVGIGATPKAWRTTGETKALQISTRGAIWESSDNVFVSNNLYFDTAAAFKYIETNPAGYFNIDPNGNFVFSNAGSGTAGTTPTITERMRILSSGGITFNGDTSTANALDDYEEGTWTPAIAFGGASVGITYEARSGTYTKIGRQVNVSCYVKLLNKGTSTGDATITGLPFTCASGSTASMWVRAITFANIIQNFTNTSSTTISLHEVTEAGAMTTITNANFSNTSDFFLTLTYSV